MRSAWLLAAALALPGFAAARGDAAGAEPEAVVGEGPFVVLDLGAHGSVALELYPAKAPDTVDNFLRLVRDRYYDGLAFHRVEDWVVQGGSLNGDGTGGPPWQIARELTDERNTRGAVGMARVGDDPNSASAQFYIVREDAEHLDGHYCVFARVVLGMPVVDAMAPGWIIESAREATRDDVAALAESTPEATPPQGEESTVLETIDVAALETAPANPGNPGVVIELSGGRRVVLELYADASPRTVEHFLAQIDAGYHDGGWLHRSDALCVQGGDQTLVGKPKWDAIAFEDSGVPFDRGAVGLARTREMDSGTSQFFIVKRAAEGCAHLNGAYANFGQVLLGMDVVDAIPERELGARSELTDVYRVESLRRVVFGSSAPAEG